MHGPEPGAWDDVNAPKAHCARCDRWRLRFTLALMLWTKNHGWKVQLELWGLCVNINYVSGVWRDLSAAKICSPKVVTSRYDGCVVVFAALCSPSKLLHKFTVTLTTKFYTAGSTTDRFVGLLTLVVKEQLHTEFLVWFWKPHPLSYCQQPIT